jgi:hypothetical protein
VRDLHLDGIGLWTPGFAGFAAWRAGAPDPAVTLARPEVLPASLRRRATPFTSMVVAAGAEAARQAGADLATLPVVLGSAMGEDSLLALLQELRTGEGMPSPTRFHNSVRNAPVAYLAIAAGNRTFSTSIAAGWETPAAALLEAAAWLADRGGRILVILGDEPPLPPFALARPFPPLAVGLLLSAMPGPATLAALRGPTRAPGAPRVPAAFEAHTCAGALALADAAARGEAGPVALGPDGPSGWAVELLPRGAA